MNLGAENNRFDTGYFKDIDVENGIMGGGYNAIRDVLYSGSDQISSLSGSTTYNLSSDISNYDYLIVKIIVNYGGVVSGTIENTDIVQLPIATGAENVYNIENNITNDLYVRGWYCFSGTQVTFALRERGATRIDSVELASVTGIKFVNPNQYSTTEQRIGTWIDGKPLYQITFETTTPSTPHQNTVMYNLESYNIKKIVDMKYTIDQSHGGAKIFFTDGITNRYNRENDYETWLYFGDAPTLTPPVPFGFKGCVGATLVSSPIVVTIQYTKTTD